MKTQRQDFTVAKARPLPVIVLADVSGSMAVEGKIEALNSATAEMIASFAELQAERIDVQVAVITFGGECATLHTPFQSAGAIQWKPMAADLSPVDVPHSMRVRARPHPAAGPTGAKRRAAR
ncbi:MAG: VWA domain-containing protein, partial [Phycisphaerales bacterium]